MRVIVVTALLCASLAATASETGTGQSGASTNTDKMETLSADPKAATPGESEPKNLTYAQEKGASAGLKSQTAEKSMASNTDLRSCGMRWHRDQQGNEGLYSVWRPTRPVAVVVNNVRNGRMYGSLTITVRPPNQELSLLINQDGLNYDGVQSCTATL